MVEGGGRDKVVNKVMYSLSLSCSLPKKKGKELGFTIVRKKERSVGKCEIWEAMGMGLLQMAEERGGGSVEFGEKGDVIGSEVMALLQ